MENYRNLDNIINFIDKFVVEMFCTADVEFTQENKSFIILSNIAVK